MKNEAATRGARRSTGAVAPPPGVRDAVRRMVDEAGVLATGRALGVSEPAVLRLAGGLAVRRGTVAQVEAALATEAAR